MDVDDEFFFTRPVETQREKSNHASSAYINNTDKELFVEDTIGVVTQKRMTFEEEQAHLSDMNIKRGPNLGLGGTPGGSVSSRKLRRPTKSAQKYIHKLVNNMQIKSP